MLSCLSHRMQVGVSVRLYECMPSTPPPHLIRRYVFTATAPGEGGFTSTTTLSDFGKLVEISAPEVPSKVMPSSSRSSLLPGSKNLAAPPRQYLA